LSLIVRVWQVYEEEKEKKKAREEDKARSSSADEKKDKKVKKEKKEKKPLSLSIPDAARPSTSSSSTFLTSGGAAPDTFGSLGFLSTLKKDTLPGRGGGGGGSSSERAASPTSPAAVSSAKSHGTGSDSGVEDSLGPAGGGGPLRSLRDLKKRSKLISDVEAAGTVGATGTAASSDAAEQQVCPSFVAAVNRTA
jgi:hypothetical protein